MTHFSGKELHQESRSPSVHYELPAPTMATRMSELEKVAPLTTIFKSFIDPILVVSTLYLLHIPFEVAFGGMEILLAVLAFLLTITFMDGTFMFLPGSFRTFEGLSSFVGSWLFIAFSLLLVGHVTAMDSYFYPPYILTWLAVAPLSLLVIHALVKVLFLPARKKTIHGRLPFAQAFFS